MNACVSAGPDQVFQAIGYVTVTPQRAKTPAGYVSTVKRVSTSSGYVTLDRLRVA